METTAPAPREEVGELREMVTENFNYARSKGALGQAFAPLEQEWDPRDAPNLERSIQYLDSVGRILCTIRFSTTESFDCDRTIFEVNASVEEAYGCNLTSMRWRSDLLKGKAKAVFQEAIEPITYVTDLAQTLVARLLKRLEL